MVSRVGQTTPYHRPQVAATNEDAPSSSIAARIADRLAHVRQNSSSHDEQSFSLLLKEVLDRDDAGEVDHAADNNPTASSRLIQVIIQAGLDTYTRAEANVVSQKKPADVIKSLKAIDLTISRCPDVLFQPLEHDSSSGFPLFAWLIPKVLLNVSDSEFEDIERLVLRLVERWQTISELETTTLRRTPRISDYLRRLITGISLATMNLFSSKQNTNFI